ncbi:MAG: Phosphate:acyl-ACP acyltransferase PlsX (EC, partial [uncultured Rubrobacteraceae bacterium]
MRLAVDALGGDNAPGEIVAGVLAAARRLPGDEIFLVGPEAEIGPHLGADAPSNVSVRPSGGPIGMEEEPAAALRSRPDAGVSVA